MQSIPFKKILKLLLVLVVVFVIGGFGGVYFQQTLLPKMRANAFFSQIGFVKKLSDNVTIINKTEQVMVQENDSINNLVSVPATAVVQIISLQKNESTKDEMLTRSGIVVTSDGIIATYRTAIIEKDAQYIVVAHDGTRFSAQFMGVDEAANIAYLKADAENLPVVGLANSSEYKSGKKLIAISNSEAAYENRFSSGLLSSVEPTFNISGKALSSTEKIDGVMLLDFIQSQEYVGSPVVAYNGSVVGLIGSVMIDNSVTYFAIPSNMLKKSIDRAVKKEFEATPVFGAYYVPITPVYAAMHELAVDHGALIYSQSGKQGLVVLSGSPAEKAGVRINDIVTAVNGQELSLENSLANVLTQYKKGDVIELSVLRDGQQMNLRVQL